MLAMLTIRGFNIDNFRAVEGYFKPLQVLVILLVGMYQHGIDLVAALNRLSADFLAIE